MARKTHCDVCNKTDPSISGWIHTKHHEIVDKEMEFCSWSCLAAYTKKRAEEINCRNCTEWWGAECQKDSDADCHNFSLWKGEKP